MYKVGIIADMEYSPYLDISSALFRSCMVYFMPMVSVRIQSCHVVKIHRWLSQHEGADLLGGPQAAQRVN